MLFAGETDLTKLYPAERFILSLKGKKTKKDFSVDHLIVRGEYVVPVRMYPVRDSRKLMIFFHGGGWAAESIDTYDRVCRALSDDTGCHVISADYSLAPEKKFPFALNECVSVIREIWENIGIFKLSEKDIILCGDSAGGNLAAASALYGRDNKLFDISKQILIYPVTDCDYSGHSPYRSVHEKGKGYTLTARHMRDYIMLYKNSDDDLENPYFAPVKAKDFHALPETLIFTAENDPLRDEGMLYANKLKSAGVKVKHYNVIGASHGFFADTDSKIAKKARKIISEYINGEQHER